MMSDTRNQSWAWLRGGAGIVAVLCLVYLTIYASWLWLHWGGAENQQLIGDAVHIPASLLAAATSLWAASLRSLASRVRWAWLFLGLSSLLNAAGDIAYLILGALGMEQYPSLADVFYTVFYVFVFAGLVIMPGAPLKRGQRGTLFLDLSITVGATLLLMLYTVVLPNLAASESDFYSQLLAIVYPVGDVVAIAGIFSILYRRPETNTRAALWFYLAGILCFIVADIAYVTLSLSGQYQSGTWPDVLYLLTYILVTFAALRQAYPGYAAPAWGGEDRLLRGLAVTLPLLALLLGYGFIGYITLGGQQWDLTLIIATVAVTLLVVLRLSLLLRRRSDKVASEFTLGQRLAYLSFPQKFVLISLLFALPLVVVTGLFYYEQKDRIDKYGTAELYGTRYLRPLQSLLQAVQEHARLDRAYRQDDATRTQLTSARERIEQHLQELEAAQAQYGQALKVTTQVAEMRRQWEKIKTQSDALTLSQSADEHQLLAAAATNLIRFVGDSSFLILDPDLDTYYMMDAVVLKLPESQTLFAQVRDLGLRAIASEATLSPPDQAQLLTTSTLLRANLNALDKNIAIGLANNASGEMRPLVERPLRQYVAAVTELLATLDAHLMGGVEITPQNFAGLAEQVQAVKSEFYDAASQALELGVQNRINRLSQRQTTLTVFSIITSLVAFILGLAVARAISRPLQQLNYATRQLAAGDMTARVNVTSRDEVGQVGSAFNDMARELQANRQSLEARTRDLALTADISRALSQQRNLQQLLTQAAELIRSRFELYYAQIYLLDEGGQRLVLRAGTGEAGRELLNRNHSLPVDVNSLNGAAAVERREVLVADTAANPAFRPNPLLPNTRAELSIPLLIGDRLLGVLDLQADRHGVLTRSNAGAFDSLTGQLAIAIENAQLFERAERARRELEAQARRLTRSGWEDYLDAVHQPERVEYTYAAGVTPPENAPVLSAPIEVVGENIGDLRVEAEAARVWATEDEELIEAVARQVAEQIENLRLLAQADQYRAEAEQAVRRMTREGWSDFAGRESAPPIFLYDAETVAPVAATATLASAVTQPLTVRGEPIGEIAVEADAAALTPEQQRLIVTVAEQLSAHVENLRLLDANQIALAETETLYNLNAQLASASTLEEILRATARPGMDAGASDARLFLVESNAGGEPLVATLAATWQREGRPLMPVGTRFTIADYSFTRLWVSDQHHPLFIGNAQTEARLDDAARSVFVQTRAMATVIIPLVLGGRWLGVVLISWDKPRSFAEAEERLYRVLAGQASVVINNRLLFDDAQRRARREAIINSITQRIQGTVSIESALQTAVQEIGVALKAQQTRVEFGPAGNGDNGHAKAGNGQPGRPA
jgi:GAF domain-containing protein/HAMP domain-containing protein